MDWCAHVAGHDKAYVLKRHHLNQCAVCRHQTSVIVGTVFEHGRVPLLKWCVAIYLMSADKGRYFGFAVDEDGWCL